MGDQTEKIPFTPNWTCHYVIMAYLNKKKLKSCLLIIDNI